VGPIGEFFCAPAATRLILGYFEMPEPTTAGESIADGWLHTGDLCARDARGYCPV